MIILEETKKEVFLLLYLLHYVVCFLIQFLFWQIVLV